MLTRQALFAHKLANAEIKGPLYLCEELEVLTRHTDSRLTVVRVAWSLETQFFLTIHNSMRSPGKHLASDHFRLG